MSFDLMISNTSFLELREQHRDPFTTGSFIKKSGDIREIRVAQCGHYFLESELFTNWSNNKDAENKIQCPCCRKPIRSAFAPGFPIKALLQEKVALARTEDALRNKLANQAIKAKWQSIGMQIGQERLSNLADEVDALVTKKQTLEVALTASEQQNQVLKERIALLQSQNAQCVQAVLASNAEIASLKTETTRLVQYIAESSKMFQVLSNEIKELKQQNTENERTQRHRNKKLKRQLKHSTKKIKRLKERSTNQKDENTTPTICSVVSRMFN